MRQKQQFVRPEVRQEVTYLPDSPILQGSVADTTTVTATGQEVQTYDFGESNPGGFNHSWQ